MAEQRAWAGTDKTVSAMGLLRRTGARRDDASPRSLRFESAFATLFCRTYAVWTFY
jgi:hypothetical protein